MSEVAATVGITASALYRHFQDKNDLLQAALLHTIGRFEDMLTGLDGRDELIAAMAGAAVSHREFPVLWRREFRHLTGEARQLVCERLIAVQDRLVDALKLEHSGHSSRETHQARAVAIGAVLASASNHHVPMPDAQLTELLMKLAQVVRDEAIPDPEPTQEPSSNVTSARLRPASRREAVLAAAIELIHERGYRAVNLDELGAAAGIAGPSVYNHFPTKADILGEAFQRGSSGLFLAMHAALNEAVDEYTALDGLVASYVRLVLAHPELFSLLFTDAMHLPTATRQSLRRMQRDYLGEWVSLLRRIKPELSAAQGTAVVHAAVMLVNVVAQTDILSQHPDRVQWLTSLVVTMLRAPNIR